MLKRLTTILLFAIALLSFGCSSDSSTPEFEEHTFEATTPVNPQPKEDRLFGITISESSDGFLTDFAEAQRAGIQVAELALEWDYIESEEGVYQDPYGLLSAVAFYEANNISLMITFAVINTVKKTTPNYLDGYNWNDPEMITAFHNMNSWVFEQLPVDLNIVGVSIGNEVNFVLENEQWIQYGEFYQAGAAHLHSIDATLQVGVKTTVRDGLFSSNVSEIKRLNQSTDVVMLNYYLLDSGFKVLAPLQVYADFNFLVSDFPGREIWLTEVGYPSGNEHCMSSENMQAGFYHELFSAWDMHRHEIKFLMAEWLHDASADQLNEWEHYYELSDPAFLEFLGTLGVRTNGGENKNAWIQLLAEANARGWE